MTEYVILQKGKLNPSGIEASWSEIAKIQARSSSSAIREALARDAQAQGSFVAVPARSWKPVTASVETKTQLKFS